MKALPLARLLVSALLWQCARSETAVRDAAPDLADDASAAPTDVVPDHAPDGTGDADPVDVADVTGDTDPVDVAEERPDVPMNTSLVGAISCGAAMCGDGQVCVVDCVGACGHDSGVAPTITYTCRPWPARCALRDCQPSSCGAQLGWTAACEAATTCRAGSAYISGRTVRCTYA